MMFVCKMMGIELSTLLRQNSEFRKICEVRTQRFWIWHDWFHFQSHESVHPRHHENQDSRFLQHFTYIPPPFQFYYCNFIFLRFIRPHYVWYHKNKGHFWTTFLNQSAVAMMMIFSRCCMWLTVLLVHQQIYCAEASTCAGHPHVDVASPEVCGAFLNETSCNNYEGNLTLCEWEADGGCVLNHLFTCSVLMESHDVCNSIRGCYWEEIPAWEWLAVNIPIWLLLLAVFLVCYRKYHGSPRIEQLARSDSETVIEDC